MVTEPSIQFCLGDCVVGSRARTSLGAEIVLLVGGCNLICPPYFFGGCTSICPLGGSLASAGCGQFFTVVWAEQFSA